ncbi:MAG: HAMP domain-containing sensor histidine kinase [Sediminibacterium sp.]
MNLRIRFALLFTFFVAVILLISLTTIYVLDSNYREAEFYLRVKNDGIEFHDIVERVKDPAKAASMMLVKALHNNTSYDEQLAIFDSSGRVLNKLPDTMHVTVNKDLLRKVKQLKEYRYKEKGYQYVWQYIDDTQYYTLSSGYDLPGINKLTNLKIILTSVFIGGVILAAMVSFFFIQEAFRPLRQLSLQMKQTTVLNLTQRLDEMNGYSEVNEIAANFNAMLERLSKAFEFQKSFVHHASHELRTPLAIMLSQTESALNKEKGETDHKKLLRSLKEEQQQLIELTNSLLLISQQEQLRFIADSPGLRIDEVLYETISSSKKMFPHLGATIMFNKTPETVDDCMVTGNDALLRSAFGNLIKNAYTYSFDKKVLVTIDFSRNDIQIHVDNLGIQFSAEEAEKVMEPFFRGKNAQKTKGFGLGLSIVQRIIFLHKGTICYTPLYDDMNRFTVTLPKAGSTEI